MDFYVYRCDVHCMQSDRVYASNSISTKTYIGCSLNRLLLAPEIRGNESCSFACTLCGTDGAKTYKNFHY